MNISLNVFYRVGSIWGESSRHLKSSNACVCERKSCRKAKMCSIKLKQKSSTSSALKVSRNSTARKLQKFDTFNVISDSPLHQFHIRLSDYGGKMSISLFDFSYENLVKSKNRDITWRRVKVRGIMFHDVVGLCIIILLSLCLSPFHHQSTRLLPSLTLTSQDLREGTYKSRKIISN